MENFELGKPICSCTSTTRADVFLIILQIYKRYNLNWLCLQDLCKMINQIYMRELIPSTKYEIVKKVGIDMEKVEYHIYCSYCKKYLQKRFDDGFEINCSCGKESKIFVSIDFSAQLKSIIEAPYSKKKFIFQNRRFKENPDGIEDIHDSKQYKIFQQRYPLQSKKKFSYTFNLDGCKDSFYSSVTIWPTYAYVNELSLEARFQNTMFIGIGVDQCEPDMNTYLKPLMETAHLLSTQGITWESSDEKQPSLTKINHSLVIPTVCCVDSMCRNKVLNMKMHGAKEGCTFCHHKTETINGHKKYTFHEGVIPTLRTDSEMKLAIIKASLQEKADTSDGIKGPTVLMNMKNFNLGHSMIPDPMHAFLLGQIKDLTNLLLSDYGEEYYILRSNKLRCNR